MNSSATLTGCDDAIRRLREAIAAGPTPGPWVKWADTNLVIRLHSGADRAGDLRVCEVSTNTRNDEGRKNRDYIAAASPDNIAALLDRVAEADEMRNVLLGNGFVKCDISACNCGSWHHRYGLPERMREIEFALADAGHERSNDNGHSILRALNALIARLDKAERENERLRSESKAQLEELDRIDDALGTNEGPSAVDHIMILKAESERLRGDAERYRWLRGREDGSYMTVYAFRTDIDEVCLGDELDAAIDAAMAADQSNERRKA